jgi:hypothetical protein
MALSTLRVEMVIEAVDAGGDQTRRTFRFRDLDDAGDVSGQIAVMNAFADSWAAVSNAVVRRVNLTIVTIPATFALPEVGQIEEHALLTAQIFGDFTKSASIDIPAPKDGIFVGVPGTGNYNIVDTADTDLSEYVGYFVGAASSLLISDGESISVANLEGRRTHSGSRKG